MPGFVSWRHVNARSGFEVAFPTRCGAGWRFEGHTVAVEDGAGWAVRYRLEIDDQWRTRVAYVAVLEESGPHSVRVEADGEGAWLVDGVRANQLEGCLDIDLEASALTNAFPIRRLRLAIGEAHSAPAAFVRAPGLVVERLEQHYLRLADVSDRACYAYEAPGFDFRAELRYDADGFVASYPGIAEREGG